MKQTFILFWNPAIQSFTIQRYLNMMSHFYNAKMNWSVWEHEKAHKGDRFFMIRCGKEGPNGLVMSGYFKSEPYRGEDWSGRGREVYYMNLDLEYAGHPDSIILTPEILTKNFPDFDWFAGHSGRLFSAEDAPKLEMLFDVYLKQMMDRYSDAFDTDDDDDDDECTLIFTDDNEMVPPSKIGIYDYRYRYIGLLDPPLQKYLRKEHGNSCEFCGFNYSKVFHGKVRKNLKYCYFGNDQNFDWRVIEKDYHCICKNCLEIIHTKEDFDKYYKIIHE